MTAGDPPSSDDPTGADAPRPPGGRPDATGADEPLTEFQRAVVEVVRSLAPGEVITYGEVAVEAGRPGAAQAVGNVLRRVDGLAWWRVVPAHGRLYRTHLPSQRPLLEREGVRFDERGRLLGS